MVPYARIVVSVFLFGFSAMTAMAGFATCPDTWVAYMEDCYLFGHTSADFTEAEHFCRQHNGHLVHVDTAAENNFIKDQLRFLIRQEWWMGLSDDLVESNWKWTDTDTTPTFTDWSHGEPSNDNGNEDCGSFWSPQDFHWNDIPCTNKYKPICERRCSLRRVNCANSISTRGLILSNATCTFMCFDQSWWMGLSDDIIENYWIWTDTDTTPTFTDWSPNEPSNGGGKEDCASFWSYRDFHWNDVPCTYKLKPICEISSSDEVAGVVC